MNPLESAQHIEDKQRDVSNLRGDTSIEAQSPQIEHANSPQESSRQKLLENAKNGTRQATHVTGRVLTSLINQSNIQTWHENQIINPPPVPQTESIPGNGKLSAWQRAAGWIRKADMNTADSYRSYQVPTNESVVHTPQSEDINKRQKLAEKVKRVQHFNIEDQHSAFTVPDSRPIEGSPQLEPKAASDDETDLHTLGAIKEADALNFPGWQRNQSQVEHLPSEIEPDVSVNIMEVLPEDIDTTKPDLVAKELLSRVSSIPTEEISATLGSMRHSGRAIKRYANEDEVSEKLARWIRTNKSSVKSGIKRDWDPYMEKVWSEMGRQIKNNWASSSPEQNLAALTLFAKPDRIAALLNSSEAVGPSIASSHGPLEAQQGDLTPETSPHSLNNEIHESIKDVLEGIPESKIKQYEELGFLTDPQAISFIRSQVDNLRALGAKDAIDLDDLHTAYLEKTAANQQESETNKNAEVLPAPQEGQPTPSNELNPTLRPIADMLQGIPQPIITAYIEDGLLSDPESIDLARRIWESDGRLRGFMGPEEYLNDMKNRVESGQRAMRLKAIQHAAEIDRGSHSATTEEPNELAEGEKAGDKFRRLRQESERDKYAA